MTNRQTIRKGRRIAAAATAALLIAGAAPLAASAATTSGDVTDGTLDWGVKESFRAYIVSPVADGAIEVLGGAEQNSDGTFRFGGGDGTLSDGVAEIAFAGTVRFTGHDGALEVVVSNPAIQLDESGGSLVADVSSLSQDGELVEFPGVVLAELAGAALEPDASGVVAADGIAAVLSAAGAPSFGGFYEAGEALDPVSFTVQTSAVDQSDEDATDDTDDAGDSDSDDAGSGADDGAAAEDQDALPKTGAPWFLVALGGLVLVVIGASFIVTGRRRVSDGATR